MEMLRALKTNPKVIPWKFLKNYVGAYGVKCK
jgi:hypothetical protein